MVRNFPKSQRPGTSVGQNQGEGVCGADYQRAGPNRDLEFEVFVVPVKIKEKVYVVLITNVRAQIGAQRSRCLWCSISRSEHYVPFKA